MTGNGDGAVIRIVAAVAINLEGETLLVRKRGTAAFMLPGGKLAFGESALDALEREVREELDCGLDLATCRTLGTYRAPAANEPGFTVEAELFAASLVGDPRPSGEIDELIWIDPDGELPYPLAQLAQLHALPLARELKSIDRRMMSGSRPVRLTRPA
jgi:8-oxo-dGTP diphosphatase